MKKGHEETLWIRTLLRQGETTKTLEGLKSAFQGENERLWDMYVLRHVEDKTFEEIGEQYGFSRQRAEQLISKADDILLKLSQ